MHLTFLDIFAFGGPAVCLFIPKGLLGSRRQKAAQTKIKSDFDFFGQLCIQDLPSLWALITENIWGAWSLWVFRCVKCCFHYLSLLGHRRLEETINTWRQSSQRHFVLKLQHRRTILHRICTLKEMRSACNAVVFQYKYTVDWLVCCFPPFSHSTFQSVAQLLILDRCL